MASKVSCAPWQDLLLGSATTYSATYDECSPDTVVIATNAVTASGATSDNQEIVYQELCGNGQLIAKVSALSGGYAGLFVRESNAAGARKGAIMTQKGSTVFRHLRSSTNGLQFQASYMASGHQWLKINRSGTQVIGSWSTNGTSWNVAFNTALSMTDCVVIGMAAYSTSSGTTINATFTNISVAQSDTIPTTEVAFADSTLEAQGGDTVQICVNLKNPCYCSPVTVDVALVTDSLPHLIGFEPQTLTFEEGDTVQCFTVVLEESDSSGTYTFELTNLEGGNDSEIGAIGELVLEVEGNEEEEAEAYTLCGNYFRTPPEVEEGDIVYYDRFANLYLEEEILKSTTLTDSCGCGEFSNTDIPGVEESYFELTFDDCVNNYDTAFNESQGDLGLMRRKVACRVFTYLSQLITPKSPACSGEEPAKVNVRFVAYNSQPVQNYVGTSTLAGASPYYENVLEGGILDCLPWRVINNGHYTVLSSHSDDELFHGEVAVDFAKQFYLGDDPPGTGDTSAYDLYSVLLHEALHFLGFASLIQPITGIPSVEAGAISYSRYDSFLKLAGGANIVARDNTDPYRWNLNIDAADLHKSCIDSGAVNMIFPPLSGDSLPIYTGVASFGGEALLGTAFSHFNANCQGSGINYLMKPSFNPGVRLEPGDAERRVLCALGYQIESLEDCACVASGDHDFTEGCEGEPLELEICDDVTELIIHLDSLTSNDQPGVQIGHLTSLTPDAGTLEFIDSVTIRFTPCAPGTHRFKYIPVADSCQEGSTVLISIKVTRCLDDCSFFSTEDPVNGGYNNNPCNLICNPEVFINSPEDIVRSIETNTDGYCYDLPGWFAATGTPDYVGEPSLTPNSGSIQLQSEQNSEAAFTPVSIGAGAYFFSFYAAAAPNVNQTGNMTLKALLVDEGIVAQFARKSGVPNNIEGIDFNEGDSLSAGSITFPFTDSSFIHRSISCIEIDTGVAYNALCFYPATPTGFRIRSFIDQVELIPDNFSAGPDTTVSCGQPVTLGGDDYCMVSDLTILYTWTDEADNTLLVYRVRKNLDGGTDLFSGASGTDTLSAIPTVEVMPILTTTYTLHREIAPGSASGLELCLPEDELVVTVTSIEPEDPAFTYDNSACDLEVTFDPVSEHEVHYWDFDGLASSTLANPAFTFPGPGVYTVSHIAGDSCVTAETEQEVLVLLPPDAGFDYDLTQCTGPFIVEVTAEDTLPGNTYAWLFDGNSSQGTATATHTFYTPGEHKIKLTVANDCGEDAVEITIFIVDCTGTEACACTSGNTIGAEGVTIKVSEAIEDTLLLPMEGYASAPAQQVCIAGTLEVDQLYGFSNSILRMLPGARIKINSGVSLNIYNSFLHGCDQMWRGIEVETGGSIKTVANTTIADAQYGVYFKSGGGGTIDENRFLRNFVGIYQAQTPVAITTHCYDNFFLGGTLKDEFHGQTAAPENLPEIEMDKPLAGIWIDRSKGFSIHKCYFENSAIGVGTRRADLLLRANRFTDIVNSGAYQSSGSWSQTFPNGMDGYGVLAFGVANTISIPGLGMESNSTATFDNCTSGIDLTGYGGSITLNRMVDVDTGIVARMVNVGGLDIYHNRIEGTQKGIRIHESEPLGLVKVRNNVVSSQDDDGSHVGIYVSQSQVTQQKLMVEDNIVTMNSGGVGIWLENTHGASIVGDSVSLLNADTSANGILLQGGTKNLISNNRVTGVDADITGHFGISTISSEGNVYCCNITNQTGRGFYFNGPCISPNKFRGNSMIDHTLGLEMTGNAILGLQKHTENEWLGEYSQFGAQHLGGQSVAGASRFEVDPFIPEFTPPSVSPVTNWFVPDTTSTTITACEEADCTPLQLLNEDPDYKRIAEGDIETESFTHNILWQLQRYLYAGIAEATVSDTSIVAFRDSSVYNTIGQFYGIDTGVKGLFEADFFKIQTLSENMDAMLDLFKDLADKDSLLFLSPEDTVLQNQRLAILDTLSRKASENDTLALEILDTRDLESDDLFDDNDAITVQKIYEQNEKEVNAIYLTTIAKGTAGFSSQQLDDLEAIAEQCPLEGGKAVFRARAMLALLRGPAIYQDSLNCEVVSELRIPNPGTVAAATHLQPVKIWPNPAGDMIHIQWPGEENASATLYNLTGQPVLTAILAKGAATQKVNIQILPVGLYWVQIRSEYGLIFTGKIVVAR